MRFRTPRQLHMVCLLAENLRRRTLMSAAARPSSPWCSLNSRPGSGVLLVGVALGILLLNHLSDY
eukprot:8681672-Pyramimonas_sp.AAC.1